MHPTILSIFPIKLQKMCVLFFCSTLYVGSLYSALSAREANLMTAIKSYNIGRIQELIKRKANLNVQDFGEQGATPLILAAHYGNSHAIPLLLEGKADPTMRNKQGKTALIVAAQEGKVEAVKSLFCCPETLDLQDEGHHTALFIATQKGNQPIVRALLNAKADVNIHDENKETVLDLVNDPTYPYTTIKQLFLPFQQTNDYHRTIDRLSSALHEVKVAPSVPEANDAQRKIERGIQGVNQKVDALGEVMQEIAAHMLKNDANQESGKKS